MIIKLAQRKPWRISFIENLNVYAFHLLIAEQKDYEKAEAKLRSGNTNEIEL